MFYVSSISTEGSTKLFGVTDTDDNIEEFYSKDSLLKIANDIDIDGVDVLDKMICMVRPVKDTIRLFNQGKYHLAISSMSTSNERFELSFKSKPTRGEMSFVSNQVFGISRQGVNRFSCDLGYSKSYRSHLTLDDVLMRLEQFSGWKLTDCRLKR